MLDVSDLLGKMVDATKTSLGSNWPAISSLATTSLETLAQNMANIENKIVDETLTLDQAKIVIDMQINAAKTVLLTEGGLALLAAEAAINAAIDVVRIAVNTAIGFGLL